MNAFYESSPSPLNPAKPQEELKTFTLSADQRKDYYKTVTDKFNEHFEPKKLVKLYMKKFDTCYQNENETIADYLSRLRDIARAVL